MWYHGFMGKEAVAGPAWSPLASQPSVFNVQLLIYYYYCYIMLCLIKTTIESAWSISDQRKFFQTSGFKKMGRKNFSKMKPLIYLFLLLLLLLILLIHLLFYIASGMHYDAFIVRRYINNCK